MFVCAIRLPVCARVSRESPGSPRGVFEPETNGTAVRRIASGSCIGLVLEGTRPTTPIIPPDARPPPKHVGRLRTCVGNSDGEEG